jgi:CRP-like cAMP-binding protein
MVGEGVGIAEGLRNSGLRADYAQLLEDMPHRMVEVDPRRPFREPGVDRNEVFFVSSGILSKFKTDGAGRRQIVALRFTGDGILPREGVTDYGIQAIVRSRVAVGSRKDFEAIIDAHPEMARFFWKLSARHAAISSEWLVNCGRRDSTARVAHLLCETAERSGVEEDEKVMINPFTQQQIADITGQTSVNVNRVFADLERQGLISRHGREITFQDWGEMRRVASFQPHYLR